MSCAIGSWNKRPQMNLAYRLRKQASPSLSCQFQERLFQLSSIHATAIDCAFQTRGADRHPPSIGTTRQVLMLTLRRIVSFVKGIILLTCSPSCRYNEKNDVRP